jgi:ribosome-associated heat shock protein Hsp15
LEIEKLEIEVHANFQFLNFQLPPTQPFLSFILSDKMEKVRIDKWLWSVRIFKSRTLAADEIKSGKVRIGEHVAKPSDNLVEGQIVFVKKDGFSLELRVKQLIDKRVAAPIAIECYENLTPLEEMNKYKAWFVGKQGIEVRERGTGRPTKRERREIDGFKGDRFEMEW